MLQFKKILITSLALFAGSRAEPARHNGSSNAGVVTYTNRNRFLFDVDGSQIDAYGTKIYWFENRYYLYGVGLGSGDLNAYTSTDLVNWKYKGVVAQVSAARPHILYNPTSKNYILWGGQSEPTHGNSISVASTPTSVFNQTGYATLDQDKNLVAADYTVYQSGSDAWLAWSVLNFADPRNGDLWPAVYQTMHISPLTSDFLNTAEGSYNVTSAAFDLVDQQTESPDIFQRNGLFYVVTSNTCGFCSGSIGVVYRSKSIKGPWKRDIISAYSCGGQVEGVLALTDPTTKEISYVWHSTTTPGGPRVAFSGHIFQPLKFNTDGSVQELDCSADAEFKVPFTLGNGAAETGLATQATDGTPLVANYEPVCDSGLFYRLYQTWTNSKTGTLKSVSINIAAGGQTNTFTINVFKFSTVADLVSPGYKWTLLGSQAFNSSSVGQTFKAVSVPLNVAVTKGDQIGFSIGETTPVAFIIGNLNPWCHLEYDTVGEGDVLLEQASGQNSPRGFSGNTSPVAVRQNRVIKFFTTVV